VIKFRLFGIPIGVQPFFLLLAVFLGFGLVDDRDGTIMFERMAAWVAVVFTGVLAHELGHAFAGRLFGLVPRIELHGFGGVTSWESQGRELSPLKSIFVSLAGPGVGISIGLAAMLIAAVTSTPVELTASFMGFVYWSLVWVNLGWGILNLVPMMPLDGGNVMASTFELFAGRSGVHAARWISLGLAVLLVIIAVALQNIFMAVLIGFLAYGNWRAIRMEREVGPDRELLAKLSTAQRRLDAGDPRGAETDAQVVLAGAKTPLVKSNALTILTLARLALSDPSGARGFLDRMPRSHPADPGIEAAVLLADGDFDAAFELLAKRLKDRQGPFIEQRFLEATRRSGRYDDAATVLDSPRGRSVSVPVLEAIEEAAYRSGNHMAAARVGQVLWDIDRRPTRAYNVACALTRAGEADQAMGWLSEARKAGFDKVDLLDGDDDLAPLRRRDDWAALRQGFGA